jgi:hypothetical protein
MQVKHVAEVHQFRPVSWQLLGADEKDIAHFMEALDREAVDTSRKAKGYDGWVGLPSDLLVWRCAHCHDLPSECLLMEREQVQAHIVSRYVTSSWSIESGC